MSKLRTTPNAWTTVLDAIQEPETRSWLESKASVTQAVAQVDLTDLDPLFASKAETALRARLKGSFVGRTRAAVEKIADMLASHAELPGATHIEHKPADEVAVVDDVQEVSDPETLEEPQEVAVTPPAAAQPSTAAFDAELDLILNPRESLFEMLARING